MFTSISRSKFDSRNLFGRQRNPLQVTLTTNAGLTFPCSPNPSSIFSSSVAGCILENRANASACFLATKAGRAPNPQGKKSKCGWAETWRDAAGVRVQRLQGFCNLPWVFGALLQKLGFIDWLAVMCSLLCDDESYEAHLPHKSFICHTDLNGETFALSAERERRGEESVCKLYIYNISSLQL